MSSIQATGTAREVEIAQKRVTIAQNAVLSTQATATIAKNAAVANSVAIWTNKEVLKNTTQAIGAAQVLLLLRLKLHRQQPKTLMQLLLRD